MHTPSLRIAAIPFVLASIVGCATPASPGIVWLGDEGARLISCPVADCAPLMALAETALERNHPGHARIVLERLGEPACGPTEATRCVYGGPLDIASRWAMVFDLEDRTTTIQHVWCFIPSDDNRAALSWNGERCFAP